jgi:glycolate oxidase FAD binding subunit
MPPVSRRTSEAAKKLDCAIAKVTMLPADVAQTGETIDRVSKRAGAHWRGVVQATGIGYLRLDATPDTLFAMLSELRSAFDQDGGSLVILQRPPSMAPLDAWGNPGDALPLMRALKQQFDPRGTLNPGRFVGGI